MIWGQLVILLVLVWHLSRKLLMLSRAQALATLIACGIVQQGCSHLIGNLLIRLNWAIYL